MKKSEKKSGSVTHESTKIPKKIKNKVKHHVQKLLDKCLDATGLNKRSNWSDLTEFYELIGNIIEIEKPYTLTPCNRDDHWEKFQAWCTQQHAKFDLIAFKEVQEGNFGAVANSDVKENETFLSVPRKIMMSELTAKSSKIGSLITSLPILQHMPNVQIAMHLLVELLDPASQWKPYISILPSSFNTVLYFTLNELKELQGSPVLDEVNNILYSVARQYCLFFQFFETNAYARSLNIGPYFTYDLYRWAVSAVMTRQNYIPSPDGCGTVTALVPLFDMCNHANGRLYTDFSLENDLLISYACKPVSKGDEVCIFYGARTNGEFFVHNAFVYPENENDAVEIKIGIGKSDPLHLLKKELCSKFDISLNGSFCIQKGSLIGKKLLTFIKINVMKADELQNALHEKFEESDLEKSSDLKKKAFAFLRDRLLLLLKCYKTTLEEDEELIKSGVSETDNQRLAIQLRMCEKKILNDAYKYCVENTS